MALNLGLLKGSVLLRSWLPPLLPQAELFSRTAWPALCLGLEAAAQTTTTGCATGKGLEELDLFSREMVIRSAGRVRQ